MPSPKGTGAPLAPISIIAPGQYGLNKQNEGTVLGPEWATDATNCTFDISGRLTARKGWQNGTTTAMTSTPLVDVIHEYRQLNGTRSIVSAAGSKLWLGVSAPTDITGTATVTVGDNWQFLNFADVCIGVQQGETPIRYIGTGSFADLTASSGTLPTGNAGLAAFGRLWIVDSDKQTIKYSGLLDENDWGGAGSGSIDLTSVWPNGMDEVVALAAYNGLLVVFGMNTVIFWSDGAGSELGIDPANIYVVDTLVGAGCIARDSIQQTAEGDLVFLSANGIQSLQRLIQERSNPLYNVSMNIRDYLLTFISQEDVATIRSIYAPKEGFYLLILPNSQRVFCFDTRYKLADGSYRVTEWSTRILAGTRSNDNTIYLSLANYGGRIGTYNGYNDVDSSGSATSYEFRYNSGWLDLGEDYASYIKILKTINGTVFTGVVGNTMNILWDFDFENAFEGRAFTFNGTGSVGEWGIGEWGIMEWGGGASLQRFNVPASGSGQYIKVGIAVPIDQQTFAIQQINLYAKLGRLAN
jgi:hypothetical protein